MSSTTGVQSLVRGLTASFSHHLTSTSAASYEGWHDRNRERRLLAVRSAIVQLPDSGRQPPRGELEIAGGRVKDDTASEMESLNGDAARSPLHLLIAARRSSVVGVQVMTAVISPSHQACIVVIKSDTFPRPRFRQESTAEQVVSTRRTGLQLLAEQQSLSRRACLHHPPLVPLPSMSSQYPQPPRCRQMLLPVACVHPRPDCITDERISGSGFRDSSLLQGPQLWRRRPNLHRTSCLGGCLGGGFTAGGLRCVHEMTDKKRLLSSTQASMQIRNGTPIYSVGSV